MKQMKHLEFRRQFLLTAIKCEQLQYWQSKSIGKYNLYVHPDCQLTNLKTSDSVFFLIGQAINPHSPDNSSSDILKEISNIKSIKDIPSFLYPLVGRFVLIVHYKGTFSIYHDACGLKSVYYFGRGDRFFAASQPSLLQLVVGITRSKNYEEYYSSGYVHSNKEHWLPSRITLYKDVYHLAPNHFVDSASGKQIRYWPVDKRKKLTMSEAVEKMSYLLRNTMIAANKRFSMAVSLTAGLDSRTVLSSTREIIDDVLVYTLKYRDLTEQSYDLKIPKRISSKLGFTYKVFDCTEDEIDEEFFNVYTKNTDISHFSDWGEIANGMFHKYPQDRVAVRGNCAEIGRCCLYRQGFHPKIKSISQLLTLSSGWHKIDFIKNELERWLEEMMDINEVYDYDILDLFYWEHRMGSWQAQSQLEWDIVQEPFSPFNNRELIECMLAVDTKFRSAPHNILFEKVIENMWKDVLAEPINPKSNAVKARKKLKFILGRIGLLNIVEDLRRSAANL